MSLSVHRSAITQIQKWFLGSRKNKGGKDKKEDETTKSIAHQTVQAALQFGVLVRIEKMDKMEKITFMKRRMTYSDSTIIEFHFRLGLPSWLEYCLW